MPNPEQQLLDVILKLRNQYLDRELAASLQRVGQPGIGDAEHLKELQQQKKLRELKRSPLAALPK